MRHNGVYFTQGDEHLDLFTTDRHEAPTRPATRSGRARSTGESRASYEGLIEIVEKAHATATPTCRPTRCCCRSDAKVDAIPSLIVKVDDVSASHGGTVGEVDEDQVFYMRTRGIPRSRRSASSSRASSSRSSTLFEDEASRRCPRAHRRKLLAAEAQVEDIRRATGRERRK